MKKTPKILVIDDEPMYRFIINQIFVQNYDQQIDQAESPFQAFEFMKNNIYDMIFLDMQMPEMDGLTALQKIKEKPEWSDIPVIAFSALSEKALFDRLTKLGASEIIVKGTDESLILNTITKYLKLND